MQDSEHLKGDTGTRRELSRFRHCVSRTLQQEIDVPLLAEWRLLKTLFVPCCEAAPSLPSLRPPTCIKYQIPSSSATLADVSLLSWQPHPTWLLRNPGYLPWLSLYTHRLALLGNTLDTGLGKSGWQDDYSQFSCADPTGGSATSPAKCITMQDTVFCWVFSAHRTHL